MLNPTEEPGARVRQALLEDVAIRRMGRFDALDARLFLALNELPHTRGGDRFLNLITEIFRGGWIWIGALLLTFLGRSEGNRDALRVLLPAVVGTTWIVEYPIKSHFRRSRPFIHVVQARVVGKKPGSWSFPSGHTASSFAAAWVLSTIWPRRSPLFLAIATAVGVSRVYAGAHYPGDVLIGALLGISISEAIRRLVCRALGRSPGGGRPAARRRS